MDVEVVSGQVVLWGVSLGINFERYLRHGGLEGGPGTMMVLGRGEPWRAVENLYSKYLINKIRYNKNHDTALALVNIVHLHRPVRKVDSIPPYSNCERKAINKQTNYTVESTDQPSLRHMSHTLLTRTGGMESPQLQTCWDTSCALLGIRQQQLQKNLDK